MPPVSAHLICCPDILHSKVTFYPICTNKKCRKRVSAQPGEPTVDCTDCKRSMMLSKCPCNLTVEIGLEYDHKESTVTAFAPTLDKFFEEDVIGKYKNSPKMLRDKLLTQDKIDFFVNNRKIVTEIVPHGMTAGLKRH